MLDKSLRQAVETDDLLKSSQMARKSVDLERNMASMALSKPISHCFETENRFLVPKVILLAQ